ncbi:MAG: IclR family transcriptional regulator C-terminal domain-containing protein [Pseudolabrys sp.]
MSVVRQGEHIPLLFGASSRILMAYLDEAERDALLRRLPRDVDRVQVERELSKFRTQGYALTRGQRVKGLTTVAVPVFDSRGRVEHCLAVTGPSVRMEMREQEMIDLMLAAGHELSKKYASATDDTPAEPARTRSAAAKNGRRGPIKVRRGKQASSAKV